MILAIDTSTRQVGVALFDGARILNESTWTSPFHHTVELAPAVNRALQRGKVEAGALAAIGVAMGPGSFTALRSGLAFAKGMALAHEIPLVGVPSLDVIAAAQPGSDMPLLTVLEAGRKRLAAGTYVWNGSGWEADRPPQLAAIEELASGIESATLICGELSPEALELLSENPHAHPAPSRLNVRRPGVLAELAWARRAAGEQDDPDTLAPIYLSTAGIDG